MDNNFFAIDIGTTKTIAVAVNVTKEINILGIGEQKSRGIEKGIISDIEEISEVVTSTINEAKASLDTSTMIDKAYVSLCGATTKSIISRGSVNIPNGTISTVEVNQVLQNSIYNSNVPLDFAILHVLPIAFKVDEIDNVKNPIGVKGSKLEVIVYCISATRSTLTNIRNTLKKSMITNVLFTLSGYMSSIATLSKEQIEAGSILIDMGGSSTDYVVLRGQSVIYEGHIPVGSKHIDSDIATMKNISVETAEILKIKYGRLDPLDDENIKKISVPKKNSDEKEYIYMEEIKNIIHARVEELLVLIYDDLKDSNMISKVGDGVVITGGLASLSGLRELTSKVFNLPVSIGVPKDINGSGFDELSLSSVVGTIHYASNLIERLELDSNRELLKRNISNQEGISDLTDLNSLSKAKDESSKGVFGKISNVFKEMF